MLVRIVLVCAALAIAAGTAVALLNGGGDGPVVAAAAPPEDKPPPPGPAPGQTTPDPEPESPIQRVEIKGRFGKACGDNGLCMEILPPRPGPSLPAPSNGGPAVVLNISYNGEDVDSELLMNCQLQDMGLSYSNSVGGSVPGVNDDGTIQPGLRRFYGTVPITSGVLEIDGMTNIAQLEVAASGVPLLHLFYGESMTITPEDTIELFGEPLTVAEIEEHAGRPYKSATCNWGDE
jgi:hypothetical protein